MKETLNLSRIKTRRLVFGAVMTSLAIGIQIAPLYLPFVGISLSALSTLPLAVAGYLGIRTGLMTFGVSGVILLLFGVSYSFVFLFGSGLLGLCLGIMMQKKYPYPVIALLASFCLTGGVLLLGKLLGFPVLPWLMGEKRQFLMLVLSVSTFLYCSLWLPVLSVIIKRLEKYL